MRHDIRLGERRSDGTTVRDHDEQLAKGGGHAARKARDRLRDPPIPRGGERLWLLFCELSAARTGGGAGANPITWGDMLDFQRLTGRPIRRWEVEGLRSLDSAYAQESADLLKRAADEAERGGRSSPSGGWSEGPDASLDRRRQALMGDG